MRKWMALLAAILIANSAAALRADAAETSPYEAINKAGRQRMLTQRLIKAYAQVGLGVFPEESREQIRESIAQFDSQFEELKRDATAPDVLERLARVEQLWKPFKAVASEPVSRAAVPRLLELEEPLVRATDEVVVLLQKRSGSTGGHLVNLSGRQRMLSQRMAKLYMLKAWGFSDPDIDQAMASTRQEFDKALAELQAAPQNNDAINRQMDEVALQWTWFQSALEQDPDYASFRLVVADSSDHMLASIATVTNLYAELAREH